jgi:tyrosine-protein phosphatase SIW14
MRAVTFALRRGSSAMSLNRRRPVVSFAALILVLWSAWPAAGSPANGNTPLASVKIDNLGQIDDHYYRGARPKADDYRTLATLGIKTVIDLTRNGLEAERQFAESAGMRFYRIPMTTTDRPSDEAVAEFLKLVTDPALQPVYVHCQEGRHRTGVMTAVYRMTQDGWTADQAYAEMKKYRFKGFPGHPILKRFVYDYFSSLVRGAQSLAGTPRS